MSAFLSAKYYIKEIEGRNSELMGEISAIKSKLFSALSREKGYRRALEEIAEVCPGRPASMARQALEGQPEVKEVTRESLIKEIEPVWIDVAMSSIKTGKMYTAEGMLIAITSHLLSCFTITERRKG